MIHPPEQQVLAELEALRTRLSDLESKERARTRLRKRVGVGAAVMTFALVGTALAANGNCPNGLPFCFAPDQPAQASQVNHNFMQVKEWIEAKTGGVLDAGVQTAHVTAGSVTSNGQLSVNNNGQIIGTGNGNFHINTMPGGGTLYLNWHTGSGGVIVGNGASGPAVTMQSNGNVNLTSVNGRRPAVSYSNNCSGTNTSCSVSCGNGGVIRQAFGLHGNNWNANVGGPWACGSGVQWMGACINQTSCTVSTGCSSAGIWIDCW